MQIKTNDLKTYLDELVQKYEVVEFMEGDPSQFPHRYSRIEDVEIVAFISSIFAFGSRKVFVQKLEEVFAIMGKSPYEYVMRGIFNFPNFVYRFLKEDDIVGILKVLNELYLNNGGLKNLFMQASKSDDLMQYVCDYFYEKAPKNVGNGFYFAIPNPKSGGAMKRMWMFLRWMVRKSVVDLGVWQDIMTPSQLKIPLDTHVARISKELGLLTRKANDKKSVDELTNKLLEFDAKDPVKYDFALFGYGVSETNY